MASASTNGPLVRQWLLAVGGLCLFAACVACIWHRCRAYHICEERFGWITDGMAEEEVSEAFGAGPGDYSGFKGMTKSDRDRVGLHLHRTQLFGADFTWKMWASPEVAIIVSFSNGKAFKPTSFLLRLEHNTPLERVRHVVGWE